MCIRDSYYRSPPIPWNYTLYKRFITQLPNPINHHLASVLDHFTSNFIYTCRFTILQLSHSTHYLLLTNNLIPKIPIPSCTIKPTLIHYHLFITVNIVQIFEVFFPHSPHVHFISFKSANPIHYSKQIPLILILNLSCFLPEELPIPL